MQRRQNSRGGIALVLVCLVALVAEIALASRVLSGISSKAKTASFSRLAGNPFAIADFDGDWKPDLAVVETSSVRRVEADYSIRLQFSAAQELSFLVTAPDGGVRVVARDVNGDSLPDLVVRSVSDERVVAVLVNHGHGQFSREEPAAYLDMGGETDVFLGCSDRTFQDQFTVASLRYSFDGENVAASRSFAPAVAISVMAAAPLVPRPVALHAFGGRSPPPSPT